MAGDDRPALRLGQAGATVCGRTAPACGCARRATPRPGERSLIVAVVARLRVSSPGHEPVAAHHETRQRRVLLAIASTFSPRSKPGRCQPTQPSSPPKISRVRRSPFFAGGDRDDRVGVHVIDVPVRDERVQRRVDARRARVEVEGAVREARHHLVFVREAAVPPLQGVHLRRGTASRSRPASCCRGRRPIP